MKSYAIIFVVLWVPLPIVAASYPRAGGFISRHGNRLRIIGAAFVIGIFGLIASLVHLVPTKVGLYFWSPLWQVLVVQASYFIWFRFYKRPPVDVVFNWDMDIVADRILAIGIALLGLFVPVLIIGR
jgi:hypothetical protein